MSGIAETGNMLFTSLFHVIAGYTDVLLVDGDSTDIPNVNTYIALHNSPNIRGARYNLSSVKNYNQKNCYGNLNY